MCSIASRNLLAASLLAACAGCAVGPTEYAGRTLSSGEQDSVAGKPVELQPLYRDLYTQGRRNEVLNLMEIGVAALRSGHDDLARAALDEAILNIESVYADNDAAQRARSLWYEEGQKDFKGEPYERSMVFYYRGLLYLKDADYGNARASFLSGLLQDAFAEEEQHATDFAALLYLAGWAAQLDGKARLAADHFAEYQKLRPNASIPDPADNVLVIAETGSAPRKLADGVGHYELVYRRGKNIRAASARIQRAAGPRQLDKTSDIYFQASTRGGRTVDRIIGGKVQFKRNTARTGDVMTAASDNSLITGVGTSAGGAISAGFAAVTAIGIAAQGLSARANTRADTRYWHGLPDALHCLTLQGDGNDAPMTIEFVNTYGQVVGDLSTRVAPTFDARGNGLVQVFSQISSQAG